MDLRDVTVEPVAVVGAQLGEGPAWDARTGTLLFVDIMRYLVYRLDPADGSLETIDLGQEVGAAIPRAAGGLVVALRDGIGILEDGDTEARIIAPIEADDRGNRMNDAKCDPQGRLWAGTLAFDFHAGAAALYRIDADHGVTRVLEGVTISNGLGWSPGGDTMYYVDSMTYAVRAFPFDGGTGDIGAEEWIITIDPDDGIPDGLAVDSEGAIWLALHGGSQVRRYRADGTPLGRVRLPVSQVTSVCFGGPTLQDLYITSARTGLDDEALAAEPLAGATFRCRPGPSGLPVTMFAG